MARRQRHLAELTPGSCALSSPVGMLGTATSSTTCGSSRCSADGDPVGFGSICGRLTQFSPRPRPTASCPEHMCGGRGISDHRSTGQGNTRCCYDTPAGFQPLSFLEHMLVMLVPWTSHSGGSGAEPTYSLCSGAFL
ncbi:hypothetical protein MHYP_G00295280 [Metynnis hypsauchen]